MEGIADHKEGLEKEEDGADDEVDHVHQFLDGVPPHHDLAVCTKATRRPSQFGHHRLDM